MQRNRDIRKRRVRWIIAGAVAIGAVVALGLFLVAMSKNQPGRVVPILGRDHIDKGQQHVAYNSKPPTSGPHWNIAGEAPVPWGIYKEPIPDEAQIHNLEHGGVTISYNCRDCPELVSQIEDFYTRWTDANRLPMFPNSTKVVVAPYYDMSNKIALTAWGHIDTFDQFDEQRVIRFIEAFRNKGPETTP
jgi:hypothetical protein